MKAVFLDIDQMLWGRQAPKQYNAIHTELAEELTSMHAGQLFDHNVVLSSLVSLCRASRRSVRGEEPRRCHAVVAFTENDIERNAFERTTALLFAMRGLPTDFTLTLDCLPSLTDRLKNEPEAIVRVKSKGGQLTVQ